MRAGARRSPSPRDRAVVLATGLTACLVLVLAGCSASGPAAPDAEAAPRPPSGPSVVKTIDPAALTATVEATARELVIPGALVEVRTRQGEFTAAVGTTQRGAQVAPAGGTHVRIASITKTMTSAVTLLLAQEGRLQLTDPVSQYVPGVPSGGTITLAQLLTMRSGLYSYTNDPGFAGALDADPARVWTPQEVLDVAFRRPPDFPPGTAYEYSNTNYVLLGLVVERVAGAPLDQVFRDRLLGPQGLAQTSLPAATDTAIPDPSARGYMYGGTRFALVAAPYPPEVQAAARAGTLQPVDYTHQNPSYAWAAGGVISTTDDLATWIRALVDGHVLGADLQRQWRDSPQPADPAEPRAPQYGYGIERQILAPNVPLYYQFGEMPGYSGFAGYDPVNQVTIVIWSNLAVGLDGQQTAETLLNRVSDQVYELPPSEPPMPAPSTTR